VGGNHRNTHLISSRLFSSRLFSSRPLTAGVVLALTIASATFGLAGTAAAAPPAPPDTSLAGETAQAAKLTLEIATNSKRADVLDERYLEARAAVKVATQKVAATQQDIGAAEEAADRLRAELRGRAALLYIGAGNQSPIDVDVESVQQLGSMTKYGDAAAQQDQRLLNDLDATESRLTAQRDHLRDQLADAKKRQHSADSARRAVANANAALKHLLDTTTATVKLLATQMEQQAEAAAVLQEQAWLTHLAQQQAAHPGTAAGGAAADPNSPFGDLGPLPAPTPGALLAVAYARAQLGKPYVYAGAGPDVFDCSGLTMMAWAQSGVLMEHGSQSQYMSFPHVPIDQLQPGDLVFFGDTGPTNHHVGIVVGPGLMIDAPHTGAYVELVSYFRKDLVPMGARP
jgi:cell wall-associated NlpC family hydrolase